MNVPGVGQVVTQLPVHVGHTVLKRFQAAQATTWNIAVNQLVADIRAWKIIGTNGEISTCNSLAFGRDKSNDPADEDNEFCAWHAHLEPATKAGLNTWATIAATPGKIAYDRTSDRVMVYSLYKKNPQHGLLILGIYGHPDPGGHRIWESAFSRIRLSWDIAAKKHREDGWKPANTISF